jgi:hypothetical protein
MTEVKTWPERHRRPAMLGVIYRVLGSVMGAIVMYALWLMAVLARMPRPPVPPSFALTLTAPVVTAVGFALGMLVVERFTQRRQSALRATFLWTLTGCAVGTLAMFPFGGMLVGFGMFGLGTAALIVREVFLHRDRGPVKSTEAE